LEGELMCLAWTLNGKMFIVAGGIKIVKFNTATWTVLDAHVTLADIILLSSNKLILASTLVLDKTLQL
jgi:hypothetical protein